MIESEFPLSPAQIERIRKGQASREDYRSLAAIYTDLFQVAERCSDIDGYGSLFEVTNTLADLVDDHPERGEDILGALHSALEVATSLRARSERPGGKDSHVA